jgi:VanZ family protein
VKRALRAWGPALLCALAIFVASSRHTVKLPPIGHADKVSHFGAYAVFGAALAYGGAATGVGALPLVAIGSLYGVSDEVHQSFVPGRSPDLLDWVADTLGVIAGVLAFFALHTRRRARAERGGTTSAPPGADPIGR